MILGASVDDARGVENSHRLPCSELTEAIGLLADLVILQQ